MVVHLNGPINWYGLCILHARHESPCLDRLNSLLINTEPELTGHSYVLCASVYANDKRKPKSAFAFRSTGGICILWVVHSDNNRRFNTVFAKVVNLRAWRRAGNLGSGYLCQVTDHAAT
jgi:hypothetical protein